MGVRPLSDRWIRRIAKTTGLDVVHAVGNGGYVFEFVTTSHRHGLFYLKAYRVWRSDKCEFRGCRLDPYVYELISPEDVMHFTSCARRFKDGNSP